MSKQAKIKDRKFWRMGTHGKLMETEKHHCRSRNCRGIVHQKKEHSPFCSRCRTRRWKSAHPLHYSFNKLRNRAKERGKEFTLTREEYISFAIKTDYARLKGKTSLSLSIDRIDNSKGYVTGNIRAISLAANSRKSFISFFARQMENQCFEPTPDEIRQIQLAMTGE